MKIAVVKLSALGDIVHALIVLPLIRRAHPDATIEWITEAAFAPLLAHHPQLSAIRTLSLKDIRTGRSTLGSEYAKIRSYARTRYDLVLDLQGLLKSALVTKLLGGASVGFDRRSLREWPAALFYERTYRIPYTQNVIWRNALLVSKALDLPITKEEIDHKAPLLFFSEEEHAEISPLCSGETPLILVVTGSSWPSKIYPKERFAEVVSGLKEADVLLLWGNEHERRIAAYIAERTHARIAPRLSLGALKALIAQSALVIGGDSGPTHMAWALNRPSITLFGPTPGYRNSWRGPVHIVLESPSTVDPLKLDREDRSIGQIPPKRIIQEARRLLEMHDA